VVPDNPLYDNLTDLGHVQVVIKAGVIYKEMASPNLGSRNDSSHLSDTGESSPVIMFPGGICPEYGRLLSVAVDAGERHLKAMQEVLTAAAAGHDASFAEFEEIAKRTEAELVAARSAPLKHRREHQCQSARSNPLPATWDAESGSG
jgi:hypothetical protein